MPQDVAQSLSGISTGVLVHRAQAGDQQAWDELVTRFTSLLWSVARAHRLDSFDAADVVQTTWLRLLEHLGDIQDPERLPGWLATTARRECLRMLKRSGREVVGGVDDVAADMVDQSTEPLDERLLTDERDITLWRCFQRLPDRCQMLLRVLMATPPPNYADVSVAMGMPIGSIGPTRGRCLNRLREMAEQAGLATIDSEIEPTGRWAR
jgi:RNA polymerase sigma factor (sigma-70 family)